jgi:hypothetical protein
MKLISRFHLIQNYKILISAPHGDNYYKFKIERECLATKYVGNGRVMHCTLCDLLAISRWRGLQETTPYH